MSSAPRPTCAATTTVEELLRDKLSEAIGGWRGAVESAVPTLAFALTWAFTKDLRMSLLVGGRLRRRPARRPARCSDRTHASSPMPLSASGISAFFALRSGQAEDAFLPGMLQNAGLLVLLLVTNLTRWPLFGFVVGGGRARGLRARTRRGGAGIRASSRSAMRLAWVLIALNVVRLAIMVPLYLAEQVAALGVAKVVLGWPAYLVAITVMGAILAARAHADRPESPGLTP